MQGSGFKVQGIMFVHRYRHPEQSEGSYSTSGKWINRTAVFSRQRVGALPCFPTPAVSASGVRFLAPLEMTLKVQGSRFEELCTFGAFHHPSACGGHLPPKEGFAFCFYLLPKKGGLLFLSLSLFLKSLPPLPSSLKRVAAEGSRVMISNSRRFYFCAAPSLLTPNSSLKMRLTR